MTPISGNRPEARVLAMRPSPRGHLTALAAAWQATSGPSIRPFMRPSAPAGESGDAADTSTSEPPYWPDGPSAA
jgi:hypothetical protein